MLCVMQVAVRPASVSRGARALAAVTVAIALPVQTNLQEFGH